MPHGHDHSHDEDYFLDQVFTIALCGALGGIAVKMFVQKRMLALILDQKFHPYVLAGGITLLVLVAVRAVALWKTAGELGHDHDHAHCGHEHCEHDHGHDHDHHHDHEHHHEHAPAPAGGGALGLPLVQGSQSAHEHTHHHHHHDHDHDHDHAHGHDHDHDPGHEHGWAPWRYTILMLPVVLALLNLPNDGFVAHAKPVNVEDDGIADRTIVGTVGLLAPGTGGPGALLAATVLYPGRNDKYGDGVVTKVTLADMRFSELEQAALNPHKRGELSGKAVTIVGKFVSRDDSGTQFSLVRYKMNCCAADALPLNAVILINPNWQGERLDAKSRQQKWVKVTGRVFFLKAHGGDNQYVPAIFLFPGKGHEPDKLVEEIDQPANPYAT